MDNEEIRETENVEEETDIFDGWDDDSDFDHGEPEATGEVSVESDEADQQSEDETSEDLVDETATEEVPAETKHKLTYMNEEKEYSDEEYNTLASKGQDYDRIRKERDEMKSDYNKLKEYESFLNEIKGDFESIDELMVDTRAKVLVDSEGITYEQAKNRIANNTATQNTKLSKEDDIQEFVQKFPGVMSEDIPSDVWKDMAENNKSLVSAYTDYKENSEKVRVKNLESENENLKKEIETLKLNLKNVDRTTGSRKSAGKTEKNKGIFEGWDDD